MKKSCDALLGALALSAISPMVNAEFYTGIEAANQRLDIARSSSFRQSIKQDTSSNTKVFSNAVPDIYRDSNIGAKAILGYKVSPSVSFELGYLKTEGQYQSRSYTRRDMFEIGDVKGKVDLTSISLDLIGKYEIPSIQSLSLLGSAGIVYQETNAIAKYHQFADCGTYTMCWKVDNRSSQKYSSYDTRAQFGVGVAYNINNQLALRTMVKLIPTGFGFANNTPFTVSAGATYSF